MARKLSKGHAEAVYRAQAATRAATCTQLALGYVVRGEAPAAVAHYADDRGSSYTIALYGLDRWDGGIAITTFRCDGQRDQISAEYFEDVLSQARTFGAIAATLPFVIAVDELRIARERAYAATRAA
jgi:hypothetical protein